MKSSMKNRIKGLAVTAGLYLAIGVSTIGAVEVDSFAAAKNKVQKMLGMTVSSIGDAPVPGLLQVVTEKGLFYISKDAKYFLQARIYNLDEGMRNETEITLGDIRLGGMSDFQDSMIEYKAEKEKFVVSVFTDITCGYCQKLHNQMDEYNDLGITVRYLAFPRGGKQSPSYKGMASVWCAEDPQEALTEAKGNPSKAIANSKNGDRVENKSCATKVAQQYAFGLRIGVSGTPNIVMPDGSMIPGYQPPQQLVQALKETL
jgi:thiol:disulfide interchange protein DsbC